MAVRAALAILVVTLLALAAAPAHAADPPLQPGIWITPAELQRLPTTGPAWSQLSHMADAPMGHADLADQNSDHDVHVLAAALKSARTGSDRLRRKAVSGIMDAIGSEQGGRTLSLARGLVAYVVAADLIDLRDYRPAYDAQFRSWLARVRTEDLGPDGFPTLVATNELRPNNWGTHAGASRAAADVYLGDERDLARAAAVFKGWLGDRSVYDGFEFGSDRSWQADPAAPVGINPPGAIRGGHDIGGALPDDMRRGCSLRFPPCHTRYPWEALQGALTEAEILSRQGYDTWNWGDQALRRAGEFLFGLQRQYGSAWEPPEGGRWLPWLLNARYGTNFPATAPADPGKGMGYTDWTASGPLACHQADCAAPRAPLRAVEPIKAGPKATPDTDTSPGSSSQQGGASHQGGTSQQGGEASLPLVAGIALAAAVVVALVALALLTRRRRRVGSRD